MQRQRLQPRIRQPLDQQPVRALDRHQLNLQAHQRSAQPPQPRFLLHERRGQKLLARRVANQHIVLFRHPVNAAVIAICTPHRSRIHFTAPRPRGTVAGAHRQALTGASPVAATRHLTPAGRGWSALGPAPEATAWFALLDLSTMPLEPYVPPQRSALPADSTAGSRLGWPTTTRRPRPPGSKRTRCSPDRSSLARQTLTTLLIGHAVAASTAVGRGPSLLARPDRGGASRSLSFEGRYRTGVAHVRSDLAASSGPLIQPAA